MLTFIFFYIHGRIYLATVGVSIAVKRGPTTIHPRKILKMGWENKFAELLVAVDPGLADTPIIKICISWTQSMKWTSVHPYR